MYLLAVVRGICCDEVTLVVTIGDVSCVSNVLKVGRALTRTTRKNTSLASLPSHWDRVTSSEVI